MRFQVWAYEGLRQVPVSPKMAQKGEAKQWLEDHWGELWAPEIRGVEPDSPEEGEWLN